MFARLIQEGWLSEDNLRSAMLHPIHRVARFAIAGPYTLLVSFTDGTEQRINFERVLCGTLFRPLRDHATFNAVRLDPETGTLVWPNGADFDPATLHDWPLVREEFEAMARGWDEPTSQQRANHRMEPTRR